MNLINQFLISGILVVGTFVYNKIIFRKGNNLDLMKEKESWKGKYKNFIKFKQYQYNTTFLLVFGIMPLITLFIGLLLGFKDEVVKLFGVLPYIFSFICGGFILIKFMLLLGNANKKAIDNIKILYESI